MKTKQRIISYKGLDLGLNIDLTKIYEQVKEKYRPIFTTLKRMVLKREKYIKRLHKQLKKKDNIMYLWYYSTKIKSKAYEIYGLNERKIMFINYLYDKDYASFDAAIEQLRAVNVRIIMKREVKELVKDGYIGDTTYTNYYYATPKGKQVIEQVSEAIKKDFMYYMKNKINAHRYKAALGNKFSQEEKQKRAELYRVMMTPFWEMGKKKIPKDKGYRCEILKNWIDDKKKNHIEVDERIIQHYDRWLRQWLGGL